MGSLREMAGKPRVAIGYVSAPKGSFGAQLRAHSSGHKRVFPTVRFRPSNLQIALPDQHGPTRRDLSVEVTVSPSPATVLVPYEVSP
jgi:hypothetical protein